MRRVRLRIAPEVAVRFPGYAALVVHASGLGNAASDARSRAVLREAEAAARAAFGSGKPADHPHVVAWREAYRAFGMKPSRTLNSAEALLTRVLRGEELPAINRLVDLYNAVSVRHVVPAGGEDAAQVAGDPELRFATGREDFDTARGGEPVVDHPDPGEVVWADAAGVTCRAWNWRQCRRTRLTESTVDAYFILDRLEPLSLDALGAAGEDLARLVRESCPGAAVESELLSVR